MKVLIGSPNEKGAIKLVINNEEGKESDHMVYDNLIPLDPRGLHLVTY